MHRAPNEVPQSADGSTADDVTLIAARAARRCLTIKAFSWKDIEAASRTIREATIIVCSASAPGKGAAG